jgi:hypothetical protein
MIISSHKMCNTSSCLVFCLLILMIICVRQSPFIINGNQSIVSLMKGRDRTVREIQIDIFQEFNSYHFSCEAGMLDMLLKDKGLYFFGVKISQQL